MNAILKIDPEFEAMCPPLTKDEYQQLEENIMDEGLVITPLIVWDDTIIDGHNRYKICQQHPDIEYQLHEKQFGNRYEVISWICKNQLGRRNLTPQQKKYLIGQRYEAEKLAHGGDRKSSDTKSSDQIGHLIEDKSTRAHIASETHTSEGYVQRANHYARGVDAAEEVLPGIKQEILSGTIRPKEPDVAAIARAAPEERRQKVEALRITPDKSNRKVSASIASGRPATAKRQELQEIRNIYIDMFPDDTPAPTSEDSILETLHGAVVDMIRVCDTLFSDFPRLLLDNAYKAKVIAIMQEPKNYILQIEGARQ